MTHSPRPSRMTVGLFPLSPDADFRERQHRTTGGRTSHGSRGTERSKDQHILDLRQQLLGLDGIGQNAVILHPAFGIDVGFNHKGIVIDGIEWSPKG